MNVRGLIPSLGAGGSLIAAVLCAAALISGTLAFRGDLGGTAEANGGDVTVPSRTVRAQTSSSGLVMPVLSLATVGGRAGRGDAPVRPRRRAAAMRPRRGTAPPAAIAPRPTAAPPPAASTAPRRTQPTPVPDPVAGTVQRAVAQVHAVADPVVQPLPAPAGHQAESVTQTVDQVAQTVDETAGGMLP